MNTELKKLITSKLAVIDSIVREEGCYKENKYTHELAGIKMTLLSMGFTLTVEEIDIYDSDSESTYTIEISE